MSAVLTSKRPSFTLTLQYADLPGLTRDTLMGSHYSRYKRSIVRNVQRTSSLCVPIHCIHISISLRIVRRAGAKIPRTWAGRSKGVHEKQNNY
jgi:hypothetical protein